MCKTVSLDFAFRARGQKHFFNKAELTVLVEIVIALFLLLSFKDWEEFFCQRLVQFQLFE